QGELCIAPTAAQAPLDGRRRAVASTRGGPSRIAAGHGCAVERHVELVLVQPKPAPQRHARATPPRHPFCSLDDAPCLTEEVRALAVAGRADRARLEWIARVQARATATECALHRRDGAKPAVVVAAHPTLE